MTDLRSSQLGAISVDGGTSPNLDASQLGSIGVISNPAAAGMNASQFAVIAVIANGQSFIPLGPVTKLGCWTPCANLMYNGE
jgi:hypothetical protein